MSPTIAVDDGITRPTTGAADLPATAIVHHPLNPVGRSVVDVELAESIRVTGRIRERLVVRPAPGSTDTFELLSGHRRFAAAQHLGLLLVPVEIVDLDDAEAARFLLDANLNRRDLTLVEEAVMVQGILDLPEAPTQHALAASLGRSDTWVSRRARIARRPETVVAALTASAGQYTLEDDAALAEFDDDTEAQERLAAAHGTADWDYTLRTERARRKTRDLNAPIIAALRERGVTMADSPTSPVPAGAVLAGYLYSPASVEGYYAEVGAGEGWFALPIGQALEGFKMYKPAPTDESDDAAATQRPTTVQRTPEQQAATDANRAHFEAARIRAAELHAMTETAAGLRRDFLLGLIGAKRPLPPAATAAVIEFVARVTTTDLADDVYFVEDPRSNVSPWLGLDLDAITEDEDQDDDAVFEAREAAYAARLAELTAPQRILAALAAAVEPVAHWQWGGAYTAAWYGLLAELGYQVSTAEAEALAPRTSGGEG